MHAQATLLDVAPGDAAAERRALSPTPTGDKPMELRRGLYRTDTLLPQPSSAERAPCLPPALPHAKPPRRPCNGPVSLLRCNRICRFHPPRITALQHLLTRTPHERSPQAAARVPQHQHLQRRAHLPAAPGRLVSILHRASGADVPAAALHHLDVRQVVSSEVSYDGSPAAFTGRHRGVSGLVRQAGRAGADLGLPAPPAWQACATCGWTPRTQRHQDSSGQSAVATSAPASC
jgi:hypothetical protein